MPTPPDLPHEEIAACLRDAFGLHGARVAFQPGGADMNAAVYRVISGGSVSHLLKLRAGGLDARVAAVPDFLRRELGLAAVMAPVRTLHGALSVRRHGFDWMLFPFFEGGSGFDRALSPTQWRMLGETLRALHRAPLPPSLLAGIPRDEYAPRWRDAARRYQPHIDTAAAARDDVTRRFIAAWKAHQADIDAVLARSETLAARVAGSGLPRVPCHADIHAGNVLPGGDGALRIIDWDALTLAPKERDLMFAGAGVGGVWNTVEEERLFFEGYGPGPVDVHALCYYRYERIVVDLVEFCMVIFDRRRCGEAREQALQWMVQQFAAGNVVACAHRAYERCAPHG